jgi:large subunit ribosomal protein L10
MALSKAKKKETLEALKEKIAKQKAMFFVDFKGFKVKDMSNLRRNIRKAGGELKAAKKTLIGLAFKDAKLDIDAKGMAGEVALVFGYNDEVSPAKMIWEASQINQNLKILGGFLDNKLIGAEQVIVLAKLPSREQLLAQVVGSIASPMSGFVNVLQGNIRGLVQALNQISKTKV